MLIRIVEGLEKPQRPGRAVCAVEFAAPATVAAIETVVDEWLPEQAAPLSRRRTPILQNYSFGWARPLTLLG